MKNFCTFLLLASIVITGCKSDREKAPAKEISEPQEVEVDVSLRQMNNIKLAHNTQKFKSEVQVQFSLKFEENDNVFFDGKVTLKTDGSKVRFLDSTIDKIITPDSIQTEQDKKLYMMAEIYSIGFWLEQKDFKKKLENDSLVISTFKSPKTKFQYNIYTHPITNVIQKIDYNTSISDSPFDSGTLIYDKYITVNRIPVALRWNFEVDQQQIATVEISRISYPDTF